MARARVERVLDLRRPVTVWRSQDLQDGQTAESLTMILRTVGCRWNRCTMCGYASEGAPASAEDLIAQFECAMERSSPEVSVVKIYTSGSFLDPAEMPVEARDEILKRLEALGIKKLVIETRPEYVTPQTVEICLSSFANRVCHWSGDGERPHPGERHPQGFLLSGLCRCLRSRTQAGRSSQGLSAAQAAPAYRGPGHERCHSLSQGGPRPCGYSISQPLQCAAQYCGGAHVGARRVSASLALVGPGGAKKRAWPHRLRSRGCRHQARPA